MRSVMTKCKWCEFTLMCGRGGVSLSNKLLISHVQKFTTFQWLLFIKILENKSEEELEDLVKDKLQLNMLQNSNWYLLIVDLAIYNKV